MGKVVCEVGKLVCEVGKLVCETPLKPRPQGQFKILL